MREKWISAGSKIEYFKSKLERGGWNIPGPQNLDDEEDMNVDQDDIVFDSRSIKDGDEKD